MENTFFNDKGMTCDQVDAELFCKNVKTDISRIILIDPTLHYSSAQKDNIYRKYIFMYSEILISTTDIWYSLRVSQLTKPCLFFFTG